MSKQPPVRTASPPPVAATPPDLSGGGDTVVEAPAEGRSTRPGPQPKIRETFSNPSMATSPDVKLLNERKYDAARSKVRQQAVEKMPDIGVGTKLPGPTPIPTEDDGTDPDAGGGDEPAEEAEKTPELDAKTAAQLAEKDREARGLRKRLRAIEESSMSATKKLAKLQEEAKKNPKGVADFLGIDFMTYLGQVQQGTGDAVKFDDEKPPESDETSKLKDENAKLRAEKAQRSANEYISKKVFESKTEDGKLRWPRIARVGASAVASLTETIALEVSKMRKLSQAEANQVVEHFIEEKEAEYKRAAAVDERPGRSPPNPRKPQTLPPKSPMEIRTAKDESDPRNRPSSREIAARLRARLIG